ncbi:MAG TPA: hypothetical protein DCL15_19745 [Chloroflexi bacterium]|nr:hypothetical protein [Chloroflexota bacterium]
MFTPSILCGASPFAASIGQIDWDTDVIANQARMLMKRSLHRLIELIPLRIAYAVEVLGLPSPFATVRKHYITLDASIRSALSHEFCIDRAFGARKLGA